MQKRSVTSVILLTAERVYNHFSFQTAQEHIICACKKQILHTAKMTSQYLCSVTFLHLVISVEVLEKNGNKHSLINLLLFQALFLTFMFATLMRVCVSSTPLRRFCLSPVR